MRKAFLVIMVLSVVVALVFSGCATARGVGKDLQSLGQKIEGGDSTQD